MNQVIKNNNISGLTLSPDKQVALQSMDNESRRIIEAALAGPMKSADYSLTVKSLVRIIGSTLQKAGQAQSAETYLMYAQEVYSVVTSKYPACTLEEIRIAFSNGVYDEYGDYFGLNPKSFIHFVRSYMTSQERAKAKEEFESRTKLLSAPVKKTPEFQYWQPDFWTEELISVWKDNTNKFFTYYIEDNMMYQATPEACYWLLQHMGYIKMTEGYVNLLIKGAQQRLRVETYKNKAKISLDKIRSIIEFIDNAQDEDINQQIRSIAMQIALFNFFRKKKKQKITQLF